MGNFMNFSSDRVNIFLILLDKSSSMEDDETNVKTGIRLFEKSFENFQEANSIAVSICKFDQELYKGEFLPVNNLNFDYWTSGKTALYYSIYHAAHYLKEYSHAVTESNGIIPNVTFIVLSDGEPCGDRMSREDAIRAIRELNYSGVTTAFIAFGGGITSNFGKEMGFMSTVDVVNRESLATFFGEELSKSCKEQSKSMKSLGANFFSQATAKTKSEGYSQTTAQALEDTSWIDEI